MSRQRLATLTPLAALLLTGVPSLGLAQSYAQDFEQTMAKVNNTSPLAGPFDYSLVQQANVLTVYRAASTLRISWPTPRSRTRRPMTASIGITGFNFTRPATTRISASSLFRTGHGTSLSAPIPQTTTASSLRTSTLRLVRATRSTSLSKGSKHLLGINGQFVASISLPDLLPSGDVYASTGFFGDISVSGRTIGLSDFTVWAIPPEEGAAPATAPAGPPPARPVTLRAGSCDALGSVIETMTDATYPTGDREGQPSAVVAGKHRSRACPGSWTTSSPAHLPSRSRPRTTTLQHLHCLWQCWRDPRRDRRLRDRTPRGERFGVQRRGVSRRRRRAGADQHQRLPRSDNRRPGGDGDTCRPRWHARRARGDTGGGRGHPNCSC